MIDAVTSDLYCPEAGFKRRSSYKSRSLSSWITCLKTFQNCSILAGFRSTPGLLEVGDVDDCERTQLDENNRLLYPFDFLRCIHAIIENTNGILSCPYLITPQSLLG
ncbi:hypothetical protein OH492_28020 [Vibrio chagasii]|nr:hypothetical protein [Vibrio chagasii]